MTTDLTGTRKYKLGLLALAQQAARQKVLDWMSEQEKSGRTVSAAQSADWNDYQHAVIAFEAAYRCIEGEN